MWFVHSECSAAVIIVCVRVCCLHSLPEHELQEESRNLEEEQETAGNVKDTATRFQPCRFMQIAVAHLN